MQRTSWRVALAVLVALLVTACGRGGDDDAADASSADADDGGVLEVDEEPASPPEPEPVLYEVQDGDTLSSIATAHEVSIDDIVAANDLDDPDAIFPGDVLEIPDPSEGDADEPGADDDAGDDAADEDAADDAGDEPAEAGEDDR